MNVSQAFRVSIITLLLCISAIPALAQSNVGKFVDCAWWLQHKPSTTRQELGMGALPLSIVDAAKHGFRKGFSEGFLSGTMGDLFGYYVGPGTVTDPPREKLKRAFTAGLILTLVQPDRLIDGWDAKCADPKNLGLELSDLGLLILLEIGGQIGGIQTDRLDEAISLLRVGGLEARPQIIKALVR